MGDKHAHAADYKINRSNQLAIDLREGKYFGVKWTVLPFYVEIGARGACMN